MSQSLFLLDFLTTILSSGIEFLDSVKGSESEDERTLIGDPIVSEASSFYPPFVEKTKKLPGSNSPSGLSLLPKSSMTSVGIGYSKVI